MNCYGTNPRYTQSVQSVNNMNTMNTNPLNYVQAVTPSVNTVVQNPYNTTSIGEWGQQVPTNPNDPTSPASIMPLPAPVTMPTAEEMPTTLTEAIYTPAYLRSQIGSLMRVEFLIGNGTTDRVGRLTQVGASYIVLSALDGGSEIMCDIYSIKFVTIIHSTVDAQLYAAFE